MTQAMETITLPLTLKSVPPNMLRQRHALIFIRSKEGKFILGSKALYPDGIHRMVGGGLDEGEEPQIGAARELEEELHITISPDALWPLAKVIADITCANDHLIFTTWVFFFQLTDEVIHPDDDLNGIAELTEAELQALITRYSQLDELKNKEANFFWQDYGNLYGPMHQIALDNFHKIS